MAGADADGALDTAPSEAPEGKVLILYSSISSTPGARRTITDTEQILDMGKFVYSKLDAALPENREERNKLFEISGIRGKFPQIFIQIGDEIKYVGDHATVFDANEAGELASLFPGVERDLQELESMHVVKA